MDRETAQTADSAVRFGPGRSAGGSTRTGARGRAREDGAVWRPLLARLWREWTPPEPWRHRPASLAAMCRYAARGGWTGPDGPARRAGVWWYRLVAVPVCLVTHYLAWLVARPSRALTAAVVVLLLWLAVAR